MLEGINALFGVIVVAIVIGISHDIAVKNIQGDCEKLGAFRVNDRVFKCTPLVAGEQK